MTALRIEPEHHERAYPLSALAARRQVLEDSRLRRCWVCGEWAYDQNDCGTCAAPADRTAFLNGQEATA